MVKLIAAALCVVFVGVVAEPPSSYLPPQARNQQPSGRYGAPSGGQQQPDSRYGAPSGRYNAPDPTARFGGSSRSSSYNSVAENQFGGSQRNGQSSFRSQSNGFNGQARQNGFGRQSQGAQGFGAPSQQYSAPRNNFAQQQPSSQYSAPRNNFAQQQPSSQYGAPSQQYSAPRNNFAQQQPSSQYGAPSQQYGAPRNGPSSEYGAPFARKMDDDLAEPANYEYNYEVRDEDPEARGYGAGPGAEFGHQETREDDTARGSYHVLLPDGRMQIVEYEADEEGYRPSIRYEEAGGYPDARNGDNQGPY